MRRDDDPPTIDTPVAVVIFKRPEPLKQLLDVIRKVEPPEMYVVADGPRDHVDGEARKVQETREFVEENIDWECEVKKNYADENLGGPVRYPTGLDWVFENTEEAIIFEDDHLPSLDFFPYCNALLDRYRDTPKVMGICGNNAGITPDIDTSYFFSNFHRTIGWATWADAWEQNDPAMEHWPEMSDAGTLYDRFHMDAWADAHEELFDMCISDETDRKPCDAVWQYSILETDGRTIIPKKNLVRHTGFGPESMHNERTPYFQRLLLPKLHRMSFPLDHPNSMETNAEFEQGYHKYKNGKLSDVVSLMDRAIHKAKKSVGVV